MNAPQWQQLMRLAKEYHRIGIRFRLFVQELASFDAENLQKADTLVDMFRQGHEMQFNIIWSSEEIQRSFSMIAAKIIEQEYLRDKLTRTRISSLRFPAVTSRRIRIHQRICETENHSSHGSA